VSRRLEPGPEAGGGRGVTNVSAYTLACFGLIGTTVVDDGILERAYAEAIATQGVVTGTGAYARSMAQVHRARGKTTIDVLRELFPGDEVRAQAAHLAFERSLSGALQRAGVRPVPGAPEALAELAEAGYRICLLSSVSRRQLEALLTALGWRDRFDLALGSDEVPRGCPFPDPVLQAMLQLGVDDVRETVVVQSTQSGVVSGRRAGAGVVAGVLTGSHPAARLRKAGATHVLASVADLPAVLAGAGGLGVAEGGLDAARMPGPRSASEAVSRAEGGQGAVRQSGTATS
jgi:phosphoglycolate phosphatase